MSNIVLKAASAFMMVLGLISLFMTTSVIFDLFGIRETEGNYVMFIVYANFFCAIIYLVSSYGFFKKSKWTITYLFFASSILFVAFVALLVYIQLGGSYEMKTVKAMSARLLITIAFMGIAWNYLSVKKKKVL
ncbi:MAG: hypothetical protein ABI297_03020 [Ginsengibacter sp.]